MEIPDQERVRREKLERLRAAGRDPFLQHGYRRTHTAGELEANAEGLLGQNVAVCGRLQARRGHGKAVFADLADESGRIQIYARLDDLGEEEFAVFADLDLGDILGARGELFRTRTGELTVRVSEFVLLAKALRPLPEKFHGLHDPEIRYRQRYLDLIAQPKVRQIFRARTALIQAFRTYLCERGFLEVETPILQPLYGGAAARPFTTYHNALDMNLYLRIAPELYLKRLLVGGFERVFEIGRMFRNEGIDTRHNPEFTMIEIYQAYADANGMMELVEGLVEAACRALHGGLRFTYRGNEIDVTPPWRRVPLLEAIREASGLDFGAIPDAATARRLVAEKDLDVGNVSALGLWEIADKIFDRYVQPSLIQPTFVTDYPVAISPLAKRKPDNPELAARFEPFLGGEEIGNAFSELNDPDDQRARFEQQLRARQEGDLEAHPMDEDYLTALEYGMPPAGGLGLGIDRLAMVLTDQPNLREVILFPLLRPLSE